ncbi:unnamed protein product [Scytosiphon promiscuus]
MRAYVLLALLGAACSHPLCYVDDRPTDYDEVLTFCPEPQAGACCTDIEEAAVEALFNDAGPLTGDCVDLYTQVVCGICTSFSGHLYERLAPELGVEDGLTMKNDFCSELITACDGQITFPTYDDGEDYCTKHTGGDEDLFWSYPYEEAEIFEAGLNLVFNELDNEADFPAQTISVHQSPDSSVYWLMGQAGEVISVDASDLTTTSTVVDISSGDLYLEYEEGLLDFAFGPLFGVAGYPSYFYLSYTCQLDDGENQRNRLSKFEYFAGDAAATLASEEVLITTAPKNTSIHSAGWVGFQPSAYGDETTANHDLYWAVGDGGPQMDIYNAGQDTTNHLGSIIRISVPSDGTGYVSPSGNLASPALPEICASGFRNPWRCSFDRETDELYCGDVGHTMVEEVDIVECGNNYGWSRFEGSRCQEAVEYRDGPCLDADRSGFTFPIFEYCHDGYSSDDEGEDAFTAGVDICGSSQLIGSAVMGGYVYRGTYFADLLYGAYIFGDNINRRGIFANVYFIKQEEGEWVLGYIISDASVPVIGFAEDNDGELMVISSDYNIYHLPCGDLCGTTCLEQLAVEPTYESLGCYADVGDDRALEIDASDACELGERSMNSAICVSYCATLGATYAGVQYGYQCFCGVDSDYSRHGASTDCDMMCTGYPDELCGGYLAIEVFEIGDVVSVTSSPEETTEEEAYYGTSSATTLPVATSSPDATQAATTIPDVTPVPATAAPSNVTGVTSG